jgi:hypothetical protein
VDHQQRGAGDDVERRAVARHLQDRERDVGDRESGGGPELLAAGRGRDVAERAEIEPVVDQDAVDEELHRERQEHEEQRRQRRQGQAEGDAALELAQEPGDPAVDAGEGRALPHRSLRVERPRHGGTVRRRS